MGKVKILNILNFTLTCMAAGHENDKEIDVDEA